MACTDIGDLTFNMFNASEALFALYIDLTLGKPQMFTVQINSFVLMNLTLPRYTLVMEADLF